MSTQNPPPGQDPNPYGQQPPTNPYGGSAGQPPADPYAGYGSSGSGSADPYAPDSGYGSQPDYYQQAYGPPPVDRRPGTVTAAAWITWVSCGLSVTGLLLLMVGLSAGEGQIVDAITQQPGFEDTGLSPQDLLGGIRIFLIVLVVLSVLPMLFALMAFRRSNVGRILLTIAAGITALLSLLSIGSGLSIVTLGSSVATIVLLFTGGASAWYARRPAG